MTPCAKPSGARITTGCENSLNVHIRHLREKLEHDPAEPKHIMTKWGVGYYLKD